MVKGGKAPLILHAVHVLSRAAFAYPAHQDVNEARADLAEQLQLVPQVGVLGVCTWALTIETFKHLGTYY